MLNLSSSCAADLQTGGHDPDPYTPPKHTGVAQEIAGEDEERKYG